MDVLIATGSADDFAALDGIFGSRARLRWAKSCEEALQVMSMAPVSIVLCEADLPGGSWCFILDKAGDRPVVVFSRFADEALWSEVLDFGAYDLLLIPFNSEEVRRVTAAAARSRETFRRHPGGKPVSCLV